MKKNTKTSKNSWRHNNPDVEKKYIHSGKRAYNNIKKRVQQGSCGNDTNFDMSYEDFLQIYFYCDKCHYCDCDLNDENRLEKNGRTLERIDPKNGYKKTNLRIVCRSCLFSNGYSKWR